MSQLPFNSNLSINLGPTRVNYPNATIGFFAHNFYDSISLNTINMIFQNTLADNNSVTVSLGLYSLNGATLSLANSASSSKTQPSANRQYLSMSAISATQNITPGTWYWGLWVSEAAADFVAIGQSLNLSAGNAFPGAFIGGIMTESTNALPVSYATSNLDITGQEAVAVPLVIISA